jgi:hypothetical protein
LITVEPNDAIERQTILQFHVAEYQALTSRSTYYIYIAFSIWPMLILLFTLVLPMWSEARSIYLLWFLCIASEFALLLWIENSWMQYNNIFYIEHLLRPQIAIQLPKENVWAYEKYLADQRKAKAQWWESYPAWIAGIILLGVSLYRVHAIVAHETSWRNWWEAITFCISCFLFLAIVKKTRRLIRLRRSIFPQSSQSGPTKG